MGGGNREGCIGEEGPILTGVRQESDRRRTEVPLHSNKGCRVVRRTKGGLPPGVSFG